MAEEKNVTVTSNSVTDTKQELKLEGEEIREGFVYTVIEETNSCFQQTANVLMIILTFVLCVYHWSSVVLAFDDKKKVISCHFSIC